MRLPFYFEREAVNVDLPSRQELQGYYHSTGLVF